MAGASGPPGGFTPFGKGKARQDAFDPEASGSASHQHWYYCIDCDQVTAHPMACIASNHFLTYLATGRAEVDLPQPSWTELSQSNAYFSDMSSQLDSNPLFNTEGTTGSSYTGGSYFGPSIELQQAEQHGLSQQILNHGANPPYNGQHELHGLEMVDQPHVPHTESLSHNAHRTLEFWRSRCQDEQRPPSEREIELIASLENLSLSAVRSWFTTNFSSRPQVPTSHHTQSMNEVQAPEGHASSSTNVLAEVAAYATDHNTRACENSQSRRAVNRSAQKALHCCLGCPYSTDDKDSWHRHHKNKFPQEFWHCVLCRNTDRRFICHRKDKMIPHLNSVHPEHPAVQQQGTRDEVRDQSYVPFRAQYPTVCPFSNAKVACSHTFSSWAEFVQHCLDHLQGRILDSADGPWMLRFKRQGPFDDDDDDSQGPSRSTSSYAAGKSTGAQATYATRNTSCGHNAACSSRSQCMNFSKYSMGSAAQIHSGPRFLIDAHLGTVVPAPTKAKYLALEYSWASRKCPEVRHITDSNASTKEGQSSSIHGLPLPFRRAMALTLDMGYRYLWIDYECEGTADQRIRDTVYAHAAFIIVIVSMDSSPDHIWHFTCDNRNLSTVLSWFETSIPKLPFMHVQNLGHGAYGIVDEVQLRTSPESFARKVCIRRKHDEQPADLHEIELLQKFDHPNIPRFIAAYYQKRTLNILMLPVAECNLKEYLNEPTAYDQRSHLQGWYYSLASAVDYMHSLSCRHKDIKPANILISGHTVLLSDFGTSQEFSPDNSTSTGPGCMTPKYCAPEVARGESRGRKADIFSLGCVFVEMITVDLGLPLSGLSRFLGFHAQPRSTSSVYHKHTERLKEWLVFLRPRVSMTHQDLVLRIAEDMIEVQAHRRPSAAEVAGRLWAVLPPLQRSIGQTQLLGTSAMILYRTSNTPFALPRAAGGHSGLAMLEPVVQLVLLWSDTSGDSAMQCFGIVTNVLLGVEYEIQVWENKPTRDVIRVGSQRSASPRALQRSQTATSLSNVDSAQDSTVSRGLRRLTRLARRWLSAARGCTRQSQSVANDHWKDTKNLPAGQIKATASHQSEIETCSKSIAVADRFEHYSLRVWHVTEYWQRLWLYQEIVMSCADDIKWIDTSNGISSYATLHGSQRPPASCHDQRVYVEQSSLRQSRITSDPRGHVYAMLGLWLDRSGTQRLPTRISPNYSSSLSEMLARATRHATTEREDLEVFKGVSRGSAGDVLSELSPESPRWKARPREDLMSCPKRAHPLPVSEKRQTLMLNVPDDRIQDFCGREDALELLGQALPETSLMWLHGMAGVGKSSLALEYVHQYQSRYEAIFWVEGDDLAKMHRSFRRLSALRDLRYGVEDNEASHTHQSASEWPKPLSCEPHLGSQSAKWLIVFDNVEELDLDAMNDFWPHRCDTSILVTSRQSNVPDITQQTKTVPPPHEAKTFELLPFTKIEATTALKRMAGIPLNNENGCASRLSALLGYLPLAISMAAVLIRAQCMTLAQFLAEYDDVNARFSVVVTQQNLLRRKLLAKNTRRLVNHHQRSDRVNRNSNALAIKWKRPNRSDQREASLKRFQKRISFHVR